MNRKRPLISIVIPTHNRGDLVKYCIASAIKQTSDDFELIISDNSSVESHSEKIKVAVEEAKQQRDIPIKLIRPPEVLNMANHFEFATQEFNGQYLAILTDHYALRPSAIEVWSKIISESETQPDIVMSNIRSGYSSVTKQEKTWGFNKSVVTKKATDVLSKFLLFDAWDEDSMLATPLPRGMNSLYRAEIIHEIRKDLGGVFLPLSPDYTSSFLILSRSQTVTYIDRPFYCHFGDQSNGRDCVVNGTAKFVATYPGLDPFEGCPTPIEAVQNTIYRDFTAMKKLEPRLAEYNIDTVGYYLSLYREILVKEFKGTQLDTVQMRAEWKSYVDQLAPELQKKIEGGVAKLKNREQKSQSTLRRMLHSMKVMGPMKDMLERGRAIIRRFKGKPTHNNVLEAVADTDHYILD